MKKKESNVEAIRTEKDKHKIAKEIMKTKYKFLVDNGLSNPLTKKEMCMMLPNIDSKAELKYLTSTYKQTQENRVAMENIVRQYIVSNIPSDVNIQVDDIPISGDSLMYMYAITLNTENSLKKIIEDQTSKIPVCKWMQSLPGIGPNHSRQLYSMIDINKAPTVGHIWSYAGIDTGGKYREKGKKCTWNPQFRSRLFLVGESFIKAANTPDNIYYELYLEKKAIYNHRNKKSKEPNKELIEIYESGKITDKHIDMMARRFMVKIFLSHLHYVWYKLEFGVEPPVPFAIAHLDHAHLYKVPNLDVVGLS